MCGERFGGDRPLDNGDRHSTIRRKVLAATKPYPSPSAADAGTSHSGSTRHQVAAEALLDMGWTAAEHGQGTVQQPSVRKAAQQRSAVDSPAAPNQPAEVETAEARAEAAKEEAAKAAAETAAAARAKESTT